MTGGAIYRLMEGRRNVGHLVTRWVEDISIRVTGLQWMRLIQTVMNDTNFGKLIIMVIHKSGDEQKN